jgi:hypothetical protein
MHRSHILARELRGTLVVLLVALMIVWLFARLNDERAEAQEQRALAQTTTAAPRTTTTTAVLVVDDNERLCSLTATFRSDLRNVKVALVNPAGDSIARSGALPIDLGLHRDGELPERGVTSTTDPAESVAQSPPRVVDTARIDPLGSGLLGEPQNIALTFYTTASALRLGTIAADFAASADYFADFVEIGEPALWDLAVLAESDFSDQWTALATRPVFEIEATLAYIEEECGIRIGPGFVYREEPPKLEIFEPLEVPTPIDPSVDPNR